MLMYSFLVAFYGSILLSYLSTMLVIEPPLLYFSVSNHDFYFLVFDALLFNPFYDWLNESILSMARRKLWGRIGSVSNEKTVKWNTNLSLFFGIN